MLAIARLLIAMCLAQVAFIMMAGLSATETAGLILMQVSFASVFFFGERIVAEKKHGVGLNAFEMILILVLEWFAFDQSHIGMFMNSSVSGGHVMNLSIMRGSGFSFSAALLMGLSGIIPYREIRADRSCTEAHIAFAWIRMLSAISFAAGGWSLVFGLYWLEVVGIVVGLVLCLILLVVGSLLSVRYFSLGREKSRMYVYGGS